MACLAAGGLFVAAGRVASVHFLGRLGRVFRVTEVGGGPRRVFLLAATAVFGPPAVVFAAGFVLPPEVLSVLVLAVALTGLVLVFVLLVNGWRLLDQLRDALGRRLGGGSTPRETRAVRSHPGERPA